MNRMIYRTRLPSPVGELVISSNGDALTGLMLATDPAAFETASHSVLDRTAGQLERYFAGALTEFDLPLELGGTPFQREVWAALLEIPYGQTRSYGEIAARIGRPRAVRAVGAANRRNPIGIIVPCHRVIGSDGSLTGYVGGMAMKQSLLELERVPAARALVAQKTTPAPSAAVGVH